MTGKHLSEEEFVHLFYNNGDEGENESFRRHIQQCPACRERYGDLTEALQALNRLAVPEQSLGHKIETFETAWRSSGLARKDRSSGFLWPVLRHAFTFSAGLACGMALLAATVVRSAPEIAKPDAPPVAGTVAGTVPAMLGGTPAAKVFSTLDDPVIVILQGNAAEAPKQKSDKEKDGTRANRVQERRVIEGTTDNGNIQVVWNL